MLVVEGEPIICALCKKPVLDDQPGISTFHFATGETDPMWEYSDTAFHESCFLAWPKVNECIEQHDKVCKVMGWGSIGARLREKKDDHR